MQNDFVTQLTANWERKRLELDDDLKKLKMQSQDDLVRKEKERNENMREFLDPESLRKRNDELEHLKSTLSNFSEKVKSIELDLRTPFVAGVHLYVKPENQKAMAEFCPTAFGAIAKAGNAVNSLKMIVASGSHLREKLDKDVVDMISDNRRMASRLKELQGERTKATKLQNPKKEKTIS